MTAMRLLDSPVRYMQSRLSMPWMAALPVLLHIGTVSAMGVVVSGRINSVVAAAWGEVGQTLPVIPAPIAVGFGIGATVAAGLVMFWLKAGALALLSLAALKPGKSRQLIELTAVAYWTQLIWAIPALMVTVLLFDPDPMRVPSGASAHQMRGLFENYMQDLAQTPLEGVLELTSRMFGLWLVALQCCALRVVSGFSIGGAFFAGVVLTVVFVIAPTFAPRFF